MDIRRMRRGSFVAQWTIAFLLGVIATLLLARGGSTDGGAAWAQNQPMVGARGIFAFTGQLDEQTYGLFMLDVDRQTVWVYAIDKVEGTRRLRLIAARTFVYDSGLKDFNCAAPDFRAVRDLVRQQERAQAMHEAELRDAQGADAGAGDLDATGAAVREP